MDARTYHEATKHSPESVRAGGRMLDWGNRPRPTKVYRDLDPIPLPGSWPEPDLRAVDVLSGATGLSDAPLDEAALARLLFLCAGVTRHADYPGGRVFFRAAPSAGALYPVEVYAAVGAARDMAPGLYHYEPVGHVLRRIRDTDVRGDLAAAVGDETIASRPLVLVFTGVPWRTTWKYGLRGYRHLFWDAGGMIANALLAARSAGLEADVVTGFVDAEVDRIVGLEQQPFTEVTLAVASVGRPEGAAHPVGVRPLRLDVAPLSRTAPDEPGLAEAHDAGRFGSVEEVRSWVRDLAAEETERNVDSPPDAEDLTVDRLVLRRGSTRRFDPSAVAPKAALTWGLEVATQPVPGDVTIPPAPFVAVHAVEDMASGAYAWQGGELQPIHASVTRDTSAHLCLDQPLGGTSAFTVFLTADLDRLLSDGGSRAYRVAQLGAGIAAERIQLAAFALGLGGTGLTFYDDEVRRFLQTELEPMLVTAVGRPTYRARPGRLPRDLPDVTP